MLAQNLLTLSWKLSLWLGCFHSLYTHTTVAMLLTEELEGRTSAASAKSRADFTKASSD